MKCIQVFKLVTLLYFDGCIYKLSRIISKNKKILFF